MVNKAIFNFRINRSYNNFMNMNNIIKKTSHTMNNGQTYQNNLPTINKNLIEPKSKSPEPIELPESPEPIELPESPEPIELPESPEPIELPESPESIELPESPESIELPESPEPIELPESPEPIELPESPESIELPESSEPTDINEKSEKTDISCEFPLENFTVISHMFNEEYLLPFWLEHHSKIFKNGIIIDYLSSDKSLDIIKKICPHWKIITTRNINEDGKAWFDSTGHAIDHEIIDTERTVEGYKICLNTTEFLFINENFKFNKENTVYHIRQYRGFSKDEFYPKNCKELFDNIVSLTDNRGERYLHNYNCVNYGTGRHVLHGSYNGVGTNEMVIIHIACYNMNKFFLKRLLQIQHNIPNNCPRSHHHFDTEQDAINCANSYKSISFPFNENNYSYELIHNFIKKNSTFNIHYSELIKNAEWGDDKIILLNDINLLSKTTFNDKGYNIFKIKDFNKYLTTFFNNKIKEVTSKTIDLEQYHNIITEEQHKKILNKMPYKKNINKEFRSFCNYLEKFVSNITNEKLKIFNDDIWVRICRPNCVSPTDNNPYHKDIYLDFYRNLLNIYIPIVGSNENSSLSLQDGSHLWNENITMITENGTFFESTEKKYSVSAIAASKIPINMNRPNPNKDEILIFSPYLIHGGADNNNENITRISLEIRFIKNDKNSRKQELDFNTFLLNRNWR